MPGGWGPGAWTPSGGQESFTGGSYSSGNGSGNGNDGQGNGVNTVDDMIGTEVIPEIPGQIVSDDDKVWELATQAYLSNPGYELSWEGQEYAKQLASAGITKGTPEYQDAMIQAFGMPNVVATNYGGKPQKTEGQYDEWGNVIAPADQYIYSGQGKYLFDQYDQPGSYEDKVAQYYSQQEEQEQRNRMMNQEQTAGYGYGYDPGGGRAGGPGGWIDVKRFSRGRPENISPWAKNIAGTPMLPVAGADELYALAAGKKAFSNTPEEQGILALLNA